MSRLDEFIKDNADHPSNIEGERIRAEYHGKPTDKFMVVTVEDLDQLRPYIELAELYVNHHEELLKSGIGVKIDSLINKIKEQGNGNN